jgi:hypothetical protein
MISKEMRNWVFFNKMDHELQNEKSMIQKSKVSASGVLIDSIDVFAQSLDVWANSIDLLTQSIKVSVQSTNV